MEISGTAPANAVSQTVYGLSPSTSYNVGVWYNLEAGYALNLSAGGTFVQTTTSGSWQFLYGTWTSSSSGTLPISISVSTNGYAYLDDVTISGGPANPTVTQSEAFGFDGFGNLLSQTPTAGTGPMMSLTADHNSNRLTGQGNYDGGGNFLGNSQYSYDILNRLSATGTSSYTYSPGSNKRMAVYWSSGTSAQAAFQIYDPNGRKMGEYTYTATAPWSRAQFQPGLSKDIWYLGSKRVDSPEGQAITEEGSALLQKAVAVGLVLGAATLDNARPPSYVPGGSLTDEKGNSIFSSNVRSENSNSDQSSNQPQSSLVGNNPREAKGRVNTDLPGGHDEAKATFGKQTEGQQVKTDSATGHQVSEDGTRLRLNPDGTARVDIPASATRPKHETVHFNPPQKNTPGQP